MKKNLFYLFALVCSMSLFTACSDDEGGDGDNLGKVISEEIVGNYSGDLDISVNGGESMPASLNVGVAKNGENAVDFSITGLSLMGGMIQVGDIKLNNCTLTAGSGNKYVFSQTVNDMSLNATMMGGLLPITADVTASGDFTTGAPTNLSIVLNINAESLGQIIEGTFEGTRVAE